MWFLSSGLNCSTISSHGSLDHPVSFFSLTVIPPDETHPLALPNHCGQKQQCIRISCQIIRSQRTSQMIL